MNAVEWLEAAKDLPLTALDLAFAHYLQQAQPSEDARHIWLAALVSHQFGRGHACLDLDVLRQSGVLALSWEALLQDLLPPDLAQAAASLPWTHGPSSPLVLDGPRLYLRRNWQAEQSIRTCIAARLAQPNATPNTLAQALDALFDPAPAPALAAGTLDQPISTVPCVPPGMLGALAQPAMQMGPASTVAPDWQKVACALAARGRFTLITGGPGTGKTTTVVRLLALLQWQATRPLRMALAAPTGKAAARLGESIAQAVKKLPANMQAHIPTQAQTLHKLLQVRAAVQARPAPELALDLVVVDEASMIDLELMARLMSSVPLSANLILLGDKDQLASVEAGAVMGQLCEGAQAGGYSVDTAQWIQDTTGQDVRAWCGAGSALAQQTVMLRHSHRFAAGSQIGQWASAVNAGQRQAVAELWASAPLWQPSQAASVTRLQPSASWDASLTQLVRVGWQATLTALSEVTQSNPQTTGVSNKLAHAPNPDAPAATRDAPTPLPREPGVCSDAQALALLHTLSQFQILCALREGPWGVLALNRNIARALGFPLDGWYAGRPVMVTRNDYNLGLMNGDIGLCLPTARGLRVAFASLGDSGNLGVRWVLPSRLDAVETVFAMTVHKSQGSEFDQVTLVLPDRVAPVLTRELLYTGITRAKTRLTLVVPQAGVLRQAVATQILRSGGLTMGHTLEARVLSDGL
ncbi:exodeoxyribonuclease V subunit alpha [Rhodoferax antarcticus]|uniref:exodeoxyribonuclease V subunit alpha n=1 Tax=Rhodoferax antarcticus TaxID=81479 RepID=UPI00222421F1|nr:exodeoxyribonuclease V subunit alpha [Rhodoferax antarcticus]MCW2312897.1 exodeoxyribonuclease V alpha subunit [Rhodoferax antarcticus]